MVAALMYLRSPEVRDWMQKNGLKGALIIQINAFPTLKSYPVPDNTNTAHTACADDNPSEPSQWLEWLATPLQGVASARERGMIYRVEQALWALQEIYDRDQLKLDRVAFEKASELLLVSAGQRAQLHGAGSETTSQPARIRAA
jgi:hypothetical protein